MCGHAFAVVVLVLAACGERVPSREPLAKPEAGQLRVMSYNVNFGIGGDPAGVRAVGSSNADIVFLQETNAEWERAFVDALGRRYPHHQFTDPPDWPAGGMGVLSRFPIVSIDTLPSHGGYFFAWRIVIDGPLGRMQVLNVHLRPPMSDGGSYVVGFFSTRDDRLREIEYHLATLDPALPTLIVGDFNEERDGLAMKRLAAIGYHDAVAQFRGTQPTWSWPVSSAVTLRFQLDHLLYDDRWIAARAHIVDGGRSDHKPIWVDLERD